MKMKMKKINLFERFDTEKYAGMEFNGYKWFYHYKGVHSFQKRTSDGYKWMLIECTEEQLYNGDIEFMTEHGLTISEEMKRKTKSRTYKPNTELS